MKERRSTLKQSTVSLYEEHMTDHKVFPHWELFWDSHLRCIHNLPVSLQTSQIRAPTKHDFGRIHSSECSHGGAGCRRDRESRACLTGVQSLGSLDVFEVFMICVSCEWLKGSLQPVTSFFQSYSSLTVRSSLVPMTVSYVSLLGEYIRMLSIYLMTNLKISRQTSFIGH